MTLILCSSCVTSKVQKIELGRGWFEIARVGTTEEGHDLYIDKNKECDGNSDNCAMTRSDRNKFMIEYIILKHRRLQ